MIEDRYERARRGSVPRDRAEHVAVLIGPDAPARPRLEREPRGAAARRGVDVLRPARNGRPDRWRHELLLLEQRRRIVGVSHAGGEAEVVRDRGDDRRQIEVLIGEVDEQHAAGLQPAHVELEGFAGQQMHRDGVGAEGIQHEQVVAGIGGVLEQEPSVPDGDGDARGRLGQIWEQLGVLRDVDDDGIDLVEGVGIGRPAIRGERAHAEADEPDVERFVVGVQRTEHLARGPAGVVVAGRKPGLIEQRHAVKRAAVHQSAAWRAVLFRAFDAVDAEEGALDAFDADAGGAFRNAAGQKEREASGQGGRSRRSEEGSDERNGDDLRVVDVALGHARGRQRHDRAFVRVERRFFFVEHANSRR